MKKDPPVAFTYFGTYRVDAAKGIVVHNVEGDHLIIEMRRTNNAGLTLPEGVEYKVRDMVRVR